jgi:hypothetical protein
MLSASARVVRNRPKRETIPRIGFNRSGSWNTWVLAAMAAIPVMLLRLHATTTPVWLISEYIVLVSLTAVVHWYCDHSWRTRGIVPFKSSPLVLILLGALLIIAPWIHSYVQRRLLGGLGEATELVWLSMLQYAALWQAAVAKSSRDEWLSFLLSCFLSLFGVATSDRAYMIGVVAPFGLLASWWLLVKYWQSVSRGFIAKSTVPLLTVRFSIIAVSLLVTSLIGLLAWTAGSSIQALDGFMPTSGGKGGSDPAARQGVGDGDMLVAAKDQAYSFGPVESDLFLESHAPSLYDLFSDLYGEPQKPNKDRTRTIALANETLGDQKHGSETKQKSREFDTLRKSPDRKMESKPKGNDSSCLLHVIGESPLLLRQQSYDFFDGRTWMHSDDVHLDRANATPSLVQLNEKPWIQVASYGEEVTWGIRDRVTIKIINLKSDRVPTPSSTTHVHIDKVDQPDFLGWSKDGQLTMPGHDFIPQLTVMHLLYKTPTLHRLRLQQDSVSFISHSTSTTAGRQSWLHRYMELPASSVDYDAMIERLLEPTPAMIRERWTKWQLIEGIVHAMRRRIKIDPNAVPPEDCDDLLAYVFETESAPDYLVATATACLVRSLGVPCRLATGFYVRPERYDTRMRLTEVAKEDLHTWVEVYCHGAWIPVEPSGGYAIPREELTWTQYALESLWWCRTWILTHPWYVLSWLLGIGFLVVCRCSIANLCISALLLPSLLLPVRFHVICTLWLLRLRCWLAGRSIPRRWTIAQFLKQELQNVRSLRQEDTNTFIGYVQRIAYAKPSIADAYLRQHDLTVKRVCLWILVYGLVRPLLGDRRSLMGRSPLQTQAV